MEGLSAIVGQDRAVTRLRTALAAGKTHHAYLFEGPDGVGKRTTALALAMAWNCETRPGDGCGTCPACRKIDAGTHPDVVVFAVFNEEGKVKDQTDRVRQLLATLMFPPHEGRARVVIVDPAHELNETASNVLLKTLEEPPPGTNFVLVTTAASQLLTTIRSRCQRVVFNALPESVVGDLLVSAHGIDRAAAEQAAALAGGSLGRALALASSDELPKRAARVSRLFSAARGRKTQEMLDAASEAAGEREESLATLRMMWVAYHDAVLLASGREAGTGAGRVEARLLADRVPTPSMLAAIRAIDEAEESIEGFVSPQLTLERLLLRLNRLGAA